jgi:hypothetical protein
MNKFPSFEGYTLQHVSFSPLTAAEDPCYEVVSYEGQCHADYIIHPEHTPEHSKEFWQTTLKEGKRFTLLFTTKGGAFSLYFTPNKTR